MTSDGYQIQDRVYVAYSGDEHLHERCILSIPGPGQFCVVTPHTDVYVEDIGCPALEKYVSVQLSEKSSLQKERRKTREERSGDPAKQGRIRGKKGGGKGAPDAGGGG